MNLQKRLNELKELYKDLTTSTERHAFTFESYIQLMAYHIDLLEEIEKLIEAIENNDEQTVKEWYKKRSK